MSDWDDLREGFFLICALILLLIKAVTRFSVKELVSTVEPLLISCPFKLPPQKFTEPINTRGSPGKLFVNNTYKVAKAQ